MERKIDCRKYGECLDRAVKKKTRFNCSGCAEYEEPPQERADEFEEELGHKNETGGTLSVGKECSVDGCEKAAVKGGMCWKHIRRQERGHPMEGVLKHTKTHKPGGKCDVEGCDKIAAVKGKCHPHYKSSLRAQPPKGGTSESTKKGRGAYLPKGPKAGEQSSVDSNQMAKAVEILIQCGFLKREKLEAAMELVKE